MDWKKIRQKARYRRRIVQATFRDGKVSVGELLEETKLNRMTLWRHLKELTETSEGIMYLEASRIEKKISGDEARGEFQQHTRRSLKYPLLERTTSGAYTLHPETERVMKRGWRPYVPSNREDALRLLKKWKQPRRAQLHIQSKKTGEWYHSKEKGSDKS